MKKILFVANKLCGGGAEKVVTLLANELSNNQEVKILTYQKSNSTYNLNDEIECSTITAKSKNKLRKKIERILKIRKIVKLYKPDTIIAFEYFVNMQVILATLGLKCKIIVSERNDPNRVGNKLGVKQLREILYRFADILVCQTPDAKVYFNKSVQKKSVIIPNPITPNLPKRFEGKRKKIIVNFCRIEPQKNLKLLVDAFELIHNEYKDYKLIIYGEGTIKKDLKEYIYQKKLEENVILEDFILDVHSKIVDCCMFVSSSNYEGISNSMLEAMGMGLPTIVTDCPCGGARMMIENNVNGVLVPVGDIKSMYEAMKKIIENPEFAEKISKNAIKINEDLRQEKICKKWVEIL